MHVLVVSIGHSYFSLFTKYFVFALISNISDEIVFQKKNTNGHQNTEKRAKNTESTEPRLESLKPCGEGMK